jgi:uncharacterized DUF497 family protein
MAHTVTVDFEWDDAKDLGNQRIIGARLANQREQALYRSYMDQYK